jgi:ABC-type multidrug transport system ATPase subunit
MTLAGTTICMAMHIGSSIEPVKDRLILIKGSRGIAGNVAEVL